MGKSLRLQLMEGMKSGVESVLSDSGWELDPATSVSAEPNWAPQADADAISFRITVFNDAMGSTSDHTNPEEIRKDIRNVVRIRCYGVKGWTWLQAFLDRLDWPETQDIFTALGFSVFEPDGDGISDISRVVSGRQQFRGEAVVEVHCRTLHDRVITPVDEFQVEIDLGDHAGDLINSTVTVDVS